MQGTRGARQFGGARPVAIQAHRASKLVAFQVWVAVVLSAMQESGSSLAYLNLVAYALAALLVCILVLRHLGLLEVRVTVKVKDTASSTFSRHTQSRSTTNLLTVLEFSDITVEDLQKLSRFWGSRARGLLKTDLEKQLTLHTQGKSFQLVILGSEGDVP